MSRSTGWIACSLILLVAGVFAWREADDPSQSRDIRRDSIAESPAGEWIIRRQYLPAERPYFEPPPDFSVLVYDPPSNRWELTPRKKVQPGQQFFVFNTLCLVGHEGLEEMHVKVLAEDLAAASRPFDGRSEAPPTENEFVYVHATKHEPIGDPFRVYSMILTKPSYFDSMEM